MPAVTSRARPLVSSRLLSSPVSSFSRFPTEWRRQNSYRPPRVVLLRHTRAEPRRKSVVHRAASLTIIIPSVLYYCVTWRAAGIRNMLLEVVVVVGTVQSQTSLFYRDTGRTNLLCVFTIDRIRCADDVRLPISPCFFFPLSIPFVRYVPAVCPPIDYRISQRAIYVVFSRE